MYKKFDKRNHIFNLEQNTVSIQDMFREFLENPKTSKFIRDIFIRSIWKEVVGEEIDAYTTRIYEYQNKLFVNLNGPTVKSEVLIAKSKILKSFNKKFEKVGIIEDIILI